MFCNFLHAHLAILVSLHFHIYLRVTLSISTRKAAGFVLIELNIYINLEKIKIITILRLAFLNMLRLFRPSLVSFRNISVSSCSGFF